MPATATSPPLPILGRLPSETVVLGGGPATSTSSFQAKQIIPSEDGKYLAVITEEAVSVYSTDSLSKVTALSVPQVLFAQFSPNSTYLVTCQRYSQQDGAPRKNLQAWSVESGEAVLELTIRSLSKDNWPCLQWTHDESAALFMVTNTIQIYPRSDNFKAYTKATLKGIGSFAISPNPDPMLAAFVPEAKGSPATAMICPYTTGELRSQVRRTFYRSSGARLTWNSKGTALLVLAYSETDATNQSYYGEQQLHYLPADPARADSAARVPVPKEGPIHDVQWSPNGDYFVVVAGFMPSKITLFDAKCKPVYDLGSGPYNLVRWNPFGRFLCVAGFGNLPGDISFYDKKADGACKLIATTRHPAVSLEWAPDGRHVLTATTAPRLRVDNGMNVFTYYGEKLWSQDFEVLYDAQWVPCEKGKFEDRPQSPGRLAAGGQASSATAASNTTASSYLPPHLRNNPEAAAAAAARFSLAKEEDSSVGRIKKQNKLPPGAEMVSKAASKNAKKRAAKKKSQAGKGGGDDGNDEGEDAPVAPKAAAAAAPQSTAPPTSDMAQLTVEDGGAADNLKKVRNLQKKLRQIQQLKEKMAAQGASALEPEQLTKIQTEAAITEEIRALGGAIE